MLTAAGAAGPHTLADTLSVAIVHVPREGLTGAKWIELLVPTVLGGVLALLGGFFASWMRDLSTRKEHRIIVERQIAYFLSQVVGLCNSLKRPGSLPQLTESAAKEMLAVCGGLERVADKLVVLDDRPFEGQVLVFLNLVRIRVNYAREKEDAIARDIQASLRADALRADVLLSFMRVLDVAMDVNRAFERVRRFPRLIELPPAPETTS